MTRPDIRELEMKKKKLIRINKKRRAKKRFAVLLFLIICIGAIFVVLKAPIFNVKTILCEGQTTLTSQEVIQIAGAKTNVNIFNTGVGKMKRRLEENPVIDECTVQRLFPNKIKIWVSESVPVVCIENNGVMLLTDKQGKIVKTVDATMAEELQGKSRLKDFAPASVKPGEYVFDEENASHKVIRDCVDILDRLGMIGDITEVQASDLSDVRLEYQDRVSVMLGSYDDMEYKLKFAKTVIEENLSKYEKATLEYRGKKFYVGPKNDETDSAVNTDVDSKQGDAVEGIAANEGSEASAAETSESAETTEN